MPRHLHRPRAALRRISERDAGAREARGNLRRKRRQADRLRAGRNRRARRARSRGLRNSGMRRFARTLAQILRGMGAARAGDQRRRLRRARSGRFRLRALGGQHIPRRAVLRPSRRERRRASKRGDDTQISAPFGRAAEKRAARGEEDTRDKQMGDARRSARRGGRGAFSRAASKTREVVSLSELYKLLSKYTARRAPVAAARNDKLCEAKERR